MRLVEIRRPGPRVWVAWSGGKNAAHALDRARRDGLRVEGLVAGLDREGRLIGSGVPFVLLEEQSRAVGLPLRSAETGPDLAGLAPLLVELAQSRVDGLVFGDEVDGSARAAHERLARETGLKPRFPLADLDPEALAETILEAGIRSVLTAVDTARAPRAWVGRTFSRSLLDERPPAVHPTGGRGEHHGFACGGPALGRPVSPRWEALEHLEGWAWARLVPGPRRGYGSPGSP